VSKGVGEVSLSSIVSSFRNDRSRLKASEKKKVEVVEGGTLGYSFFRISCLSVIDGVKEGRRRERLSEPGPARGLKHAAIDYYSTTLARGTKGKKKKNQGETDGAETNRFGEGQLHPYQTSIEKGKDGHDRTKGTDPKRLSLL